MRLSLPSACASVYQIDLSRASQRAHVGSQNAISGIICVCFRYHRATVPTRPLRNLSERPRDITAHQSIHPAGMAALAALGRRRMPWRTGPGSSVVASAVGKPALDSRNHELSICIRSRGLCWSEGLYSHTVASREVGRREEYWRLQPSNVMSSKVIRYGCEHRSRAVDLAMRVISDGRSAFKTE
jgi:hypothetical protein